MNAFAKTLRSFCLSALALTLMVGSFSTASAQSFLFGPRVGFGFTPELSASDLIIRSSDDLNALQVSLLDASPEVQMGVFGRLKIRSWYIQPELLFTTASTDYTVEDLFTGEEGVFQERLFHLTAPVMFGFKKRFFRIQGGPVLRTRLFSSSELSDIGGIERHFDRFTIGAQAGIGFDLGDNVVLDFRYELPLAHGQDELSISGQTYTLSPSQGQVVTSLGISF